MELEDDAIARCELRPIQYISPSVFNAQVTSFAAAILLTSLPNTSTILGIGSLVEPTKRVWRASL